MKKFFKVFLILLLVAGCARTISDLILKVGNGTDADVKIEMELGKGGSNPYLNYDTTNDAFQFCNEGAACANMGSGSGGGSLPLMAKGSLLTSNGTANGEYTACADGEIIEWDATQANGFKCITTPSGGGGGGGTRYTAAWPVASPFAGTFINVSSISLTAGDVIKVTFEGDPYAISSPQTGDYQSCTIDNVLSVTYWQSNMMLFFNDPDNVNDARHGRTVNYETIVAGTYRESLGHLALYYIVPATDTYDLQLRYWTRNSTMTIAAGAATCTTVITVNP